MAKDSNNVVRERMMSGEEGMMMMGGGADLLLTFGQQQQLLLLGNNMVEGKVGSRNKGAEVEKKRNMCIVSEKKDGGYYEPRLLLRNYRCLLLVKSSVVDYHRKLVLPLSSEVV